MIRLGKDIRFTFASNERRNTQDYDLHFGILNEHNKAKLKCALKGRYLQT